MRGMLGTRISTAIAAVGVLAAALLAATLLGPGAATARECSYATNCADVSVSGHAEPQPIRRGGRSTLKITVKNNGPGRAWDSKVTAEVPRKLKVKKVHIAGDGNDYGCSNNGYGYVECYPGQLSPEELAVMKVKVKAKKKGTYVTPANVYNNGGGWYDPNGGNNQVGITIGVQRRR